MSSQILFDDANNAESNYGAFITGPNHHAFATSSNNQLLVRQTPYGLANDRTRRQQRLEELKRLGFSKQQSYYIAFQGTPEHNQELDQKLALGWLAGAAYAAIFKCCRAGGQGSMPRPAPGGLFGHATASSSRTSAAPRTSSQMLGVHHRTSGLPEVTVPTQQLNGNYNPQVRQRPVSTNHQVNTPNTVYRAGPSNLPTSRSLASPTPMLRNRPELPPPPEGIPERIWRMALLIPLEVPSLSHSPSSLDSSASLRTLSSGSQSRPLSIVSDALTDQEYSALWGGR